ncbi:MAG: hypothetical protein AAB883_00770 [Patescibacteria group bacterium]
MAVGKVVSNRFRNEKGDDVYVRVSEEPVVDTEGVLLYVQGPDSDAEMHVTRQEAHELLMALTKLLRPGSRR